MAGAQVEAEALRLLRRPAGNRACREEESVKITSIETLRTDEFANVLWVRVHTDSGPIGLGETFYGAGAVEAQIHDTFAGRLLGRDPLRIEALHREMLNLPMAQSSTGVEYRAASAIDIALWDLFGKVCGQPVHQMLGGLCRDRQRIYNTCAGTKYVRSSNIRPVSNWSLGDADSPYEDLDGFMNRADALAENLLESGITAMKIWPFDPPAQENQGLFISAAQMKKAVEPFEKIRKAVRDAMHVVMADLCWTGGLTEGRKIAAMAETYHRPFAPHDCIGPIGFIAAIHMSFSQPNTLIQESVRAFYKGWYNELVTTMPVIKDGYVYPMEGPGLGVDLLPAVFDRSDLVVRRSNV